MKNNAESKSLRFLYRSLIQLCQKQSPTAQGYVLFLIISVSIALSGLLIAYALLAKVHSISMKSSADSNNGFYAAEAALNVRAEQLRSIFIDYRKPTGTPPSTLSACMDADTSNDGTGDYSCQAQTFAAANSASDSLSAYSYVVSNNAQSGGTDQPTTGTVPPGESFQNLNMLEYRYSINTVAKKTNSPTDQVTAMTGMVLKSRLIPMFQFAAFYLNDLEILPGADMNLSGPIHTNSNLYLGANTLLSINSQVTVSKNLYNSRKNDGSTYPNGRVRIKTPTQTTTPFAALLQGGTGSTAETTNPMNPNLIAATWFSQIKLGVDALSIPDAGILDLNGDYYQKADLRINYTPAPTNNNSGSTNATSPDPATVPFAITSIRRTSSGTVTSSIALTEGELRSLRQPVLVSQALSGTNIADANYRLCTVATAVNPGAGITLTGTQKTAIVNALNVAIVSQTTPLAYDSSNPAFSATKET
ncbi:MAG: hypothetical protein VKL42_14770, partial [Snowella sp.]|nr:hypothetical protein [Snowella sp.]